MSSDSKVPIGSLMVDARPAAKFIVDLQQGSMQGMRTEQRGYADVVAEVLSNHKEHGEQAGITAGDIDRLLELDRRVAELDKYLPAARKLVELLTESRAVADDARQRLVSSFAQSVEGRAKASRTADLLAKYEKTRAYRSAIGKKAVKTRQKNAALATEAEAAAQEAEG